MKLVEIPKNKYDDYRLNVIFNGYKWDPQFLDNNTIAKHVLVISEEEHEELVELVEELAKETIQAEQVINKNQKLAKKLLLPKKLRGEIKRMENYDPNRHVRLMRYDFHPLVDGGWAISEVNSDVPGGFAESSLMPKIALDVLENEEYTYKSFGDVLINAIVEKVDDKGRIMFVHCTSYSDDRQVMQFLGDRLSKLGYESIYCAADHIKFTNNEAISILDSNEGKVDAIIRFTPLEWIVDIKPKRWEGYFDTTTISCNHPIAIYTQSKRFPLIWDELETFGVKLDTWRKLLPETVEVKFGKRRDGFIYKPVWGRVGEGITIKEACKADEYKKIIMETRLFPKRYIYQKKFDSRPLEGNDGNNYHVCLGAYNIDGKAAGYYARISKTPRIDSNAADIPVLIERKKK